MQSDLDTIRSLNDAFRSTFKGGQIMLTRSIAQMCPNKRRDLLNAIRKYNDFDRDDEGYEFNEHDLAILEFQNVRYMFKIDYYDSTMKYGSENPANTALTTRVMTIMQASEY